jgi:hypothetical protein
MNSNSPEAGNMCCSLTSKSQSFTRDPRDHSLARCQTVLSATLQSRPKPERAGAFQAEKRCYAKSMRRPGIWPSGHRRHRPWSPTRVVSLSGLIMISPACEAEVCRHLLGAGEAFGIVHRRLACQRGDVARARADISNRQIGAACTLASDSGESPITNALENQRRATRHQLPRQSGSRRDSARFRSPPEPVGVTFPLA